MASDSTNARRRDLRRELESAEEELRRLAVERMEPLPDEEALPLLVPRLGDPSWRVRKAAVERIGLLGNRSHVAQALVAALADGENAGLRNAALEALIRCGVAALPALLEAARNPDPDVRKQVVDALAGIGDPRAADCLGERLEDPDANVRGAAADALGMLGLDSLAPRLLVAALDDSEGLVRLSALRALARLERAPAVVELAPLTEVGYLRASVYEVLAHSEEPEAQELLLKGLEAPTRAAREAAMGGLLAGLARAEPEQLEERCRRIREGARAQANLVPDALDRLARAPLAQRLPMIQFLGLLKLPETVLPILEAARDEALRTVARETLVALAGVAEEGLSAAWPELDGELRSVALDVLALTGGASADPLLLAALSDSDPALRAAAARALGKRGCRAALERLIDRLHASGSEPVELAEVDAVCDAIVELAAPSPDLAAARLVAGLRGGRESYRCAAARILGRLGRGGDDGSMGMLMSDPSARVRRAAVEGLVELSQGESSSADMLQAALADEAPEVRAAAAAFLEHREGSETFAHLVTLASDPAPTVRAAAIRVVGRRTEARSDPEERERALALYAARLGDDGAVAMAVAEALDALGGSEAAQVALGLLARLEPEAVRAAVVCIGHHGNVDQLRELIPWLAHGSWAVRAEAVKALASRRVGAATPAILRRLELEQDPFVREAVLDALRRLES